MSKKQYDSKREEAKKIRDSVIKCGKSEDEFTIKWIMQFCDGWNEAVSMLRTKE